MPFTLPRLHIMHVTFFTVLSLLVSTSFQEPLVVVPSSFRWNSSNEVLITPLGPIGELVDFDLEVRSETPANLIYRQRFRAKIAGSTFPVEFDVPGGDKVSSEYSIIINGQNKNNFQTKVGGSPDVRIIHVQTDKAIYRPSEIVRIRALPLTAHGQIYVGDVNFIVVNPDGFELLRKTEKATDRFIASEFELPAHLNFGEWSVIARASGDRHGNTYPVTFEVQDYVLPPFKVLITTAETGDSNAVTVNVAAKYPQGASVSGILSLNCERKRRTQKSAAETSAIVSLVRQSEIAEGYWSQRVDIRGCVDDDKKPFILTAEVHDAGAGNHVSATVEVDTNLAGFTLIPLRPGFTKDSRNLHLLIRSVDGRLLVGGGRVEISVKCVCTDRARTTREDRFDAAIGSLLLIPIDSNYECRTLIVQGRRKIGDRLSRSVTLLVPSFGESNAVNFSWIDIALPPAATFLVGDKLVAAVPTELAPRLNYLVVCNSDSIAAAGRARDDGIITFEVSAEMVHQCVLYVFNVLGTVRTDMFMFFAQSKCPYSVSVSKDAIVPGENITFTLNGGRNGIATAHAIDQRMFALLQTVFSVPTQRFWDLTFFNRPELKDDQARLLNFLDSPKLFESFGNACREAGFLLMTHTRKCSVLEDSSSAVSQYCLRQLRSACEQIDSPESSKVIDRQNIVAASIVGRGPMKVRPKISKSREQDVSAVTRKAPPSPRRPRVREFFPEVWLFDDFLLGPEGGKELELNAPDSVTQWSLSGSFWTPGDLSVCTPKAATVTSDKKFFLSVEMPKHVYVNETITARVTVTTDVVERETTFSICINGLERRVCADIGADGQRGQTTYSRVQMPAGKRVAAKSFTFRFLNVGESEVRFALKREVSYPGRYHCDFGDVFDEVKMKLSIAKRAETEEHFKRLILNAEKPLNRLTRPTDNDDHDAGGYSSRKDPIDYTEERNGKTLRTNIRINLPDTETVYSIGIELSKFLPPGSVDGKDVLESQSSSSSARAKRGIFEQPSFLSDALKQFAATLYAFKSLHLQTADGNFKKLEQLENQIGSIMSEVLTFSDYQGNDSCGFSEYGRPAVEKDRSLSLSTVAIALLCEAGVHERIVCPTMRYIFKKLVEDQRAERNGDRAKYLDDDYLATLDFKGNDDRSWFLKALINQLASDCQVYDQCIQNDFVWTSLWKSFFSISDQDDLDLRTVAALAYMAPLATRHLMRFRMYSSIQEHMLPYWTAGSAEHGSFYKMASAFNLVVKRTAKSGDLLANSLGLLAFVSRGVDPTSTNVNFDSLADWIYEQLNEEGVALTALDTYFAHRALHEYRIHKVGVTSSVGQQVLIECDGCTTRKYNVSELAVLFNIPSVVRSISLSTEGSTKVRAGVRVIATKRQRLRRELNTDDYYPVTITVVQTQPSTGVLRQEVCLSLASSMITSLEITHGLFTGFSTNEHLFQLLHNTSSRNIRVADKFTTSSFAAHFVLINLKANVKQCYELGSTEPNRRYEADQLAPIAIIARHPSYDVIGQSVLAHVDRAKRANADDTVDTICWDGACSCAEAACTVRCAQCQSINEATLTDELCSPNNFGATVEITSKETKTWKGARYSVMEVAVKFWTLLGSTNSLKPGSIEIWLRSCNLRCQEGNVGETFIIVGNVGGITTGHNARYYYVLREDDRWERANDECKHVLADVITMSSCPSRTSRTP